MDAETKLNNGWAFSDPTPSEPPVDTLSDAGKSVAAQGTLGISDVLGIPAGISKVLNSGVDWVARKGMDAANHFGANINPDEIFADRDRAMMEGLSPEGQRAVLEGRAIPALGGTLPTGEVVEETVKGILPYTGYEAKTDLGKAAGTAARFATGNALMGPMRAPAVIARTAEGVTAGAGSEVAGQWAEANMPEYETWARFAGSLAVPGAIKKSGAMLKPWVMPKAFADETAMKLLAEDIRKGKSRMSVADINAAIENGATPSIIDMAGPKTRAWLGEHYGLSNEMIDQVAELNQMIAERAPQATGNVRSTIQSRFPGIDAADIDAQVIAAQEAERKRLYDLTKNVPAAHAVWNAKLADLAKDGPVAAAMQKVNKDFLDGNISPDWGVNIPTGGLPPNLQYWDAVKKRLDDVINNTKPGGINNSADTSMYEAATAAKRKLMTELDAMVPEYAGARDSHSELLGLRAAPEVGEAFGKVSTSGEANEIMGVYNKYTPEQKELFKRGLVRSFYDKLGKPGATTSSLIKSMTSNAMKDRYKAVLGADDYNALIGRLTAEDLMSKAAAIQERRGRPFLTTESAKSAAILAAGQAATFYTTGGIDAFSLPSIISGVVAGGGVLKDVAFNYAEKRVAPRVAELMASNKPEDIKRLGEMISNNPDVGSLVSKIGKGLTTYPLRYAQSKATSSPGAGWNFTEPASQNYDVVPNGLATGGRAARKSGGRVRGNPISAEVKRVRALLSQKTASMLSMPDDAVATALKIAKGKQ